MKFICDIMLGKLAKYLRMAGIDVNYNRSVSLSNVIKTAAAEGRTILTRRRDISSAALPVPYFLVNSNYPHEQLHDVINHFSISLSEADFFSRCLQCNELLAAVDKSQAYGKVPDYVLASINYFSKCSECSKIYWKGTHYDNMLRQLNALLYGARGAETL